MRMLLALFAGLGALIVIAPVCFVLAIVLAGPHSSLLPSFLQPPLLLLGWAVVLGVPLWIGRRVWRRTGATR